MNRLLSSLTVPLVLWRCSAHRGSPRRPGSGAFRARHAWNRWAKPTLRLTALLVLWSAAGKVLGAPWDIVDLGTLGGTSSSAHGINASGQVAGGSSVFADGPSHAFLYSNGQMTDLGTLGGIWGFAEGINASGQVAGNSSIVPGGLSHAFLYSNGQMTDLGTLGGTSSYATESTTAGRSWAWRTPTVGATPFCGATVR